jgi:hypothetical protein
MFYPILRLEKWPGKADIAKFIGNRFQVSGFGCQGAQMLTPNTLYENDSEYMVLEFYIIDEPRTTRKTRKNKLNFFRYQSSKAFTLYPFAFHLKPYTLHLCAFAARRLPNAESPAVISIFQHSASNIEHPAYRFGIPDCRFQMTINSTINRLKDLRSIRQ